MAPDFVFAHLADAHVGAWPRDPGIRAALRASLLRALSVVEERDAQFLLISGDLFHTPVPDPGEAAPVAAALRRLVSRGVRIYVIYGSHDYVAHRLCWLDVLAESGLFLRAAPEAVRAEGGRLTLPFLRDEPTGAVIAGISGRSHGLDREYFRSLDSEAFRAEPGFKIFQFHAAVTDYLPESLRGHIPGVSRQELPGGCDYYAGGHIHMAYQGEGPEGGLLINPGAVFGTSVTDLERASRGDTHQGLVIVTVRAGRPHPEFVDTVSRESIAVVDVDISGRSIEEARRLVEERVLAEAAPGRLLLPRLRGALTEGGEGTLGLRTSAEAAEARGVAAVHWDIRDVAKTAPEPPLPEDKLEAEAFRTLAQSAAPELPALAGDAGSVLLRTLFEELSTPPGEGERRQDYVDARIKGALAILGIPAHGAAERK